MIDPYATVVGDGTTFATRSRSRWQALRWPLAAVAVVLLAGVALVAIQPRVTSTPYSPEAVGAEGARALAQVLAAQGVTIETVATSRAAVAAAGPGTTLLVAQAYLLDDAQVARLAAGGPDLVVLEPRPDQTETLTDGALTLVGASVPDEPLAARCEDPDAAAAATAVGGRAAVTALDDRATVCFRIGEHGLHGTVTAAERRVDVLDAPEIVTNDRIDEAGNAALALRLLGRHEHLVWYLPQPGGDAVETAAATAPGAVLPDWTTPVALLALLTVLVAAAWRARGLGPVVSEPLPVVVRAGETTRGRGRLYRRGRARGRAAAALRAGTASRVAAAVGLPRTASPGDVVEAIAHVTGRDRDRVTPLLYGPPPADDPALLALARALADLEREVHHP